MNANPGNQMKIQSVLSACLLCGLTAGSLMAEDSLYVSVDTSRTSFCNFPEARQFDFWLGTWSLTWGEGGNAGTGRNVITEELGQCMVEENFSSDGSEPFVGRSVSVYDKKTGQWKQTWTDNRGGYLDFTGGWQDGKMILSRAVVTDSVQYLQRMVWSDITPKALEWNWEQSDDGGDTWQVLWNIHFRRK